MTVENDQSRLKVIYASESGKYMGKILSEYIGWAVDDT
jgi:hypothetical protein